MIKKARGIISGRITQGTSIEGDIVKEPVWYNKPWSWYLNSDSINFFQQSMEVCESSVVYLEEHLNEVGGAFLPKGHWCSWQSYPLEEVVFDWRAGLSTLPIKYESHQDAAAETT